MLFNRYFFIKNYNPKSLQVLQLLTIIEKLIQKNVLISAHGNSLRALCKYLFKLDNDQISGLEIPTGNPLIIEFDKKMKIKSCEYLDKERSKDLIVF